MLVAGLRGAQVVLLVLCAYLLYATAVPLLSSAPTVRDVRLAEHATQPPEAPSLERLAVIWRQSPFDMPKVLVAPKPAPPPPPTEKVKSAESLGWQLMTTAAATPVELSVAGLLSTKSGLRRTVRVGDKLDGRTVIEIERRRVILNNGGKLEQLEISENAKAPRRTARSRRGRSAASRQPRTRLRRPEPPRPSDTRDPGPASGELAKRIFGGRADLADGEEIVSVNGVPLDDPSRLPELAEALAGGAATLQVRALDGGERDVSLEAAE